MYWRVSTFSLLAALLLFGFTAASTNLANGKATYSSTSTNDSHRPREAVDGESNSYFQSSTSTNQWWRVDLGGSYYVGVIKVYSSQYEKFQQVSIFLSNIGTVPTSPLNLPNNNDWTELPSQFSLKESGDDFVTNVTSSQDGSLMEARHIAVYSTSSDGLVINEVEVYGYEVLTRNVAVGKSAGSSSVILYIPKPRTADKANDGVINSDDFYRSENNVGDQWWKVDLDTQYFIVGVLVYNHKNLIPRLQKVHLLAANTDIDPDPDSNKWTKLYYQDGEITHSTPNNYFQYNPIDEGDALSVYRYVAVYSKYKPGLALSEVLVFGIEKSELLVKNLRAELKEPDCVVVNWETPLTDSYTFQYQVRYDSGPWKDTNTSLFDKECGFSAYKEVEVEVTVVGSDKTESTTLTTNCADPSKPNRDKVQHVEVTNLGRKMWKYNISWKAPTNITCESITEYKIRYPDVTSEEIVTTDTSYEVYVEGGVEFTLLVRAVNNMGLHSDYLDITETSPDIAPQWGSATVTMETLNSSCVGLTWSRPEYPGGDITSYQLTCTNMAAMDKIPSTSTSQTVCGYSAYTLVECNISAENTAGFGEYIEFNSVYTSCEAPVLHLPANLSSYVKQEESLNFIRIILNTSDVDVTVNCDELTQLVYRVDTETEYTDVGEYIEGLEPGTEYTVEIRAENNAGLGTTQTFDIFTTEKGSAIEEYTTPIKDEVAAGTQSSNPGSCKGGCIGGVVVGVVVVLVVVSILVYRIRTAREHQSKLKNISLDESGYQNMQQINDEEGGTGVVLPQETPRLERVTNTRSIAAIELPEMRDSVLPPQRSIPVSRLADYIENNEASIIDQFQMLEKLPKPNMSAAQLPENGGKCKYVGLYPEDSTRVILNRPREQGTDFINASYIEGYTSDDMFIAAQGPQPATVDDFWLMIWQERPKAIIMVTNLFENGKAKAVQYWPDQSGSSCVFGDLKVTLTTCECLADYVIRTLNIKKEGKSMSIKQFHYLSWPDHGVPQYISPFLIFVRRVMSVTSHMTGCLVVHCSAGVGRSGTFIALDTLVKQAKDTGEVNPFEVVRAMRRRRPCMVQTKEQYVFTHQALEEYLVTDEFSCEATELETKLADNGDDIYVNRNIISEEFDRIEAQLRREIHNYSIGMEESNINKNRFPDILPSSRHGIYAGGAYINAVVVDSYRKKQSVIATQLPLSNTVKDFWTMVLEQEIKVVVQLEMEEDVFYPSRDTEFVDSDGCIVSRTGSEVEKNVKIIKLTVKSRKVSNVTLICINNWLDDGNSPFPKPLSLLSYLGTLEKYQQWTGDEKICITDLDGSTRCGLFICAYGVVEKLKTEQEVNVYSTVLRARQTRPQFSSNLESYKYLYNLLQAYIDGFSEYGNFKVIN